MTKEHGLLLRGSMVRQRWAGAKTSTMRPMTRQNTLAHYGTPNDPEVRLRMPDQGLWDAFDWSLVDTEVPSRSDRPHILVGNDLAECWIALFPRIQKGDTIWFKERWGVAHENAENLTPKQQAEDARMAMPWASVYYYANQRYSFEAVDGARWRSSMLMPRWAARDVCTVTAHPLPVRPCDLTEAEKRAEGFPLPDDDHDAPGATFEEFIQSLHKGKGDVMKQWFWLYSGLTKPGEAQ